MTDLADFRAPSSTCVASHIGLASTLVEARSRHLSRDSQHPDIKTNSYGAVLNDMFANLIQN